jgi:Ca2+-binding RTX toxin-like protein
MKTPFALQIVTFGLLALIVISSVTAFAAGITVSASNAGRESVEVVAQDLAPSACNGLMLAQVISGSGTLTGTSGNDLIIGSPDADVIDGLGGNDCIIGGAGDDFFNGEDGTDVCLGGPGIDNFTNCETEAQ